MSKILILWAHHRPLSQWGLLNEASLCLILAVEHCSSLEIGGSQGLNELTFVNTFWFVDCGATGENAAQMSDYKC